MLVSQGLEPQPEVVMLANNKFTALFGYSIEEISDVACWWPLAYPDEAYRRAVRTEWQVRVREAIKNRCEMAPMEAKVRCKDGSYRHIEFHFSSLGETNLVLLFANTVTYFSGSKCRISGRVGIRRIVSDAATEPLLRGFV